MSYLWLTVAWLLSSILGVVLVIVVVSVIIRAIIPWKVISQRDLKVKRIHYVLCGRFATYKHPFHPCCPLLSFVFIYFRNLFRLATNNKNPFRLPTRQKAWPGIKLPFTFPYILYPLF